MAITKKCVVYGEYTIIVEDSGSITVTQDKGVQAGETSSLSDNTLAKLKVIANNVDFQFDEGINTRQLGNDLVDFLNGLDKLKSMQYVPCETELINYNNHWWNSEELSRYVYQESALNWLFIKNAATRANTDINVVLIKCSVLNDFYSTHIENLNPVAQNIVLIPGIDQKMERGDDSLIDKIAKSGNRYNYSFATKYCSHHYPDKFPIFDRYVKLTLLALRKKFPQIMPSPKEDLRDYSIFRRVIDSFRSYFGLQKYSYKEIDRYLWLLGKRYF